MRTFILALRSLLLLGVTAGPPSAIYAQAAPVPVIVE